MISRLTMRAGGPEAAAVAFRYLEGLWSAAGPLSFSVRRWRSSAWTSSIAMSSTKCARPLTRRSRTGIFTGRHSGLRLCRFLIRPSFENASGLGCPVAESPR